jgi:hypothetical protein
VTGQVPTGFMKEWDAMGDKSPKNTAKTNKQKSQKKAPKSSKK